MTIAGTPQPPYYAALFSSQRNASDDGYAEASARMLELASAQPGFLGVESARGEDGFGITVSYWESDQAIAAWKANVEHALVRERGRRDWYAAFAVRVAKVERAYGGTPQSGSAGSSRLNSGSFEAKEAGR